MSAHAPLLPRDAAVERQKWFDVHVKTFEHVWAVWPFVEELPPSFPRLSMVAQFVTCDQRYYSSGLMRSDETHCVFQYTLEGRGFFRDGSGEYPIEAGQGFLCAINDPATSYYYGEQNGKPWRFLAVCLEGEAAHVMVRDLVETRGPIFRVPLDAPIWRQLQNLRGGQYSTPHVSPMTAVDLASMMMVVLAQSGESRGEERADMLMKKALHRLSLPTPLPEINDLAQSLHVSREHFSRVFRRQMGVSPQQWIGQERINRACRLLCSTDFSNKQIAFQLGYDETSSFVRAFRRAMHLSPQQFRQSMQDTTLPASNDGVTRTTS